MAQDGSRFGCHPSSGCCRTSENTLLAAGVSSVSPRVVGDVGLGANQEHETIFPYRTSVCVWVITVDSRLLAPFFCQPPLHTMIMI